jgi:hypothetical protein
MPIVISNNFILTQPDNEFPVTLDHPIIGWHNIVTSSTIEADTAEASNPASNLANPATHLYWRAADTTEQYLTITTNYVDEIDYLAVAGHNFSTAEITVSVEGFIDGVWTEIVEEHMLSSDGPLLFRFTSQSLSKIRLKMQAGVTAARAAVVYVGSLLTLERKIYVGHTPMVHGRKNEILNGYSETGNFLGRNVLGSWRESTIPLSLISPRWYRENMDAFLEVAVTTPFFFAWRPETYPSEVGYAYLMEDPMPTPQSPSNKLAFDLKVRGVV